MDIVKFDTTVSISPREFGRHLRELLYRKIIDMFVGTCWKQHGFIIEILDFSYEHEFMVSRVNHCVQVVCHLEVLSTTPTVGSIYYAVVKNVYPRGVFVSLINIFDTLIPLDLLEKSGYVFSHTPVPSFRNAQTGRWIAVGDMLNVELVNAHYDSKTFNCIARVASDG